MGGSGGGGGSAPSKPKEITCEDVKFICNLSSPVADVLELIDENDVLEITLSPDRNSCVAIFEGKVAGSIVGASLNQLINCLKAGNRFIAVVREIDGAKCSVRIVHESAL